MKKNVLLVEDDPALRMVMREVLKDEFEIEEADNGADGIAKGLKGRNDLVILDYHLPKKDGLQVIEAIKAAHPELPVIVITGFLSPDSEAKFAGFGADRIFPKPCNYRELLESVRCLMLGAAEASQPVPMGLDSKPFALPQPPAVESELLADSLNAIASLAEKVEFLQSVSEKYWIEPSDISAVRETARAMECQLQAFYGKANNALFESAGFTSPVLAKACRPQLSGSN